MRALLQPLRFLALGGFLLSVAAHLAAIAGYVPTPWVMSLHVGIFLVWFPAILVALKMSAGVARKDFWKLVLRGCPPWMRNFAIGLVAYSVLNFALFAAGHQPGKAGEAVNAVTVRGFSGHWMVFYFAAYAIITSALKLKDFGVPKCPACGSKETPLANFCSQCGARLEGAQGPRFE